MSIDRGYLGLQEFKDGFGDSALTSPDGEYERAIEAASRWIDDYCERHFWLEAAPVARLVRATSRMSLRPGDFPTTTGMVVEVDLLGDGQFTTLDPGEWQPEPFAPWAGWPYERVSPTGTARWPTDGLRPRVRVTARWGWVSVPKQVQQACQILASAYVKASDVTGTRTGFDRFVDDPMSPLGVVRHLLEEFAPTTDEMRVSV